MSTKDDSPTAGSPQGGYGSPTPEDEMPDSAGTTPDRPAPPGHSQQSEAESTDPLLDPFVPSQKDPQAPAVSEADLKDARNVEPPD